MEKRTFFIGVFGIIAYLTVVNANKLRSFNLTPEDVKIIDLRHNETIIIQTNATNNNFYIFEAHAKVEPIEMSKTSDFQVGTFSEAPNTGLFIGSNSSYAPEVYIRIKSRLPTKILVMVRLYDKTSPLPGGCNVVNPEFKNVNPVHMNVSFDRNVVQVDFATAGIENMQSTCDEAKKFHYRVYQYFMSERDFTETHFFSSLQKMLLLDDITTNGHLVDASLIRRSPDGISAYRALYSAYPGVGSIYAVIVDTDNASSVYVTSASYACNLNSTDPLNCDVLSFTTTKILVAVSIFIGVFVAFLGHRFFKTSQFVFGLATGAFIGYILLDNVTNLNYGTLFGTTCIFALIGGLIWLGLWVFMGIPIIAVVLPTSLLGLLCASVILILPPLNVSTFTNDLAYWLTLVAITFAVPLITVSFTKTASIMTSAILGTFAIVVPVDHYIGSCLKYLVVNVIRRATVPEFSFAILYTPFQVRDIGLVAGWVVVTLIALIFQQWRETMRAPFPPNPFQQWRWRRDQLNEGNLGEGAPLLRNNQNAEQVPEAIDHSQRTVGYIAGYGSFPVPDRASNLDSLSGSSRSSLRPSTSAATAIRRERVEVQQRPHRDIFKPPTPGSEDGEQSSS